MSRKGARRPSLLEPPKRSPPPSLLPTVSFLAAVCLVCLPSAAAPRDRVPSGAGYAFQSQRVKAAQEVRRGGRGALALALTRWATLGQPHGGSVVHADYRKVWPQVCPLPHLLFEHLAFVQKMKYASH